MKDNKLIAEFMEHEPIVKGNDVYYELNHIRLTSADDLRYHNSWDWLMPVLDKVKKIRCLPDEHDESFSWVCKSSDIEAEYNAVVEFIKEYNDARQ